MVGSAPGRHHRTVCLIGMTTTLQQSLNAATEIIMVKLSLTKTARYFTIIEVGAERVQKAPEEEVWIVARVGSWPHSSYGTRLQLWTACSAADWQSLYSRDARNTSCIGQVGCTRRNCSTAIAFGAGIHVAHNVGFLAKDRRILGIGGMFRNQTTWRGQRAVGAVPGAFAFDASSLPHLQHLAKTEGTLSSSSPVAVRGDHPGCSERRRSFVAAGGCEFDGRFSIAATADGTLLVYARANLHAERGSRHVQVATGPSLTALGPFRLIEIEDEPPLSDEHPPLRQLYFAAVKANPADGGRSLIGLFPVSLNASSTHRGDSFIGLGLSCDGVHFSKLLRAADSDLSDDGDRSLDQPVDGFVQRGGLVHFFVHRDVPGIAPRPDSRRAGTRQSRLVRKTITMASLRSYTSEVVKRSRWCQARGGGLDLGSGASSFRPRIPRHQPHPSRP